MPYDLIVKKIKENSEMTDEKIELKVKEKLDALSGLISKEGAAHIVANELGVNLFEGVSGRIKIKDIVDGMRNVEILAKVQNVFEVRDFISNKGTGKVGSFFVADETGAMRVTCWHAATDKMTDIKTDDVVIVKGGYVRDNQGRLEVHMNENAEIAVNPEGETIGEVVAKVAAPLAQRKKIDDLEEGSNVVEILGTVVQVFDPRFFEICPQCGKRARQREENFVCEAHGNVTPDYSYVMNAFIDDGTESIRGVFFREQAEQLTAKDKESFLEYRKLADKFEEVKTDLLGQIVKISGKVTKNQMFDRLEFLARNVDRNPDPKEELDRVKKQNT